MMKVQNPIYTGCSLHSFVGFNQKTYPTQPFAKAEYDINSTTLSTNGAFAMAIREVRVRYLTIHTVRTQVGASLVDIRDTSDTRVWQLTIPQAEITPGRVIKFPGDGMRFPHGIGIKKDSADFDISITYDWVL